MVALGRLSNVEELGLERAGIEQTDRGHIIVDDYYRTSTANIYAVGDVIGPPSLAASAMEQGRRAMCHALQQETRHDFSYMPFGIYAIPEMASVGLNETEAREKFGDVVIGRARIEEVARAQISGEMTGLLKLIVAPDGRKLLGVHIVSQGASDLIHAGELALLNGNDVSIFLENVLNFPTMSQAYRIAALDVYNQATKPAEVAVG
jgi:NAD(P) transhydrogenase